MEKGLIFINAGPNIIRFLPPLNVTKEQIDQMYEILVSSIEEAFC
jgi:acetylornithine/N-succinyldiaminopimelate aminotransferase